MAEFNITILQKLPDIRKWIDHTLATHRAAAKTVASYSHPRLKRFYSPELLKSTSVVEVPRVPVPPLASMGLPEFSAFENGDYVGITYMNTYFIREDNVHDESLHFHELVHVLQWQHLGPDKFLMAYAAGYLLGGGYRENPLEEMAYRLQDLFDKGGSPFDTMNITCRMLDSLIPSMLKKVFSGE